MALNNRTVVIPGRLSYAHLNTPHTPNDQADSKYSATLLIPKSDTNTIQAIQTAVANAVTEAVNRGTFKQKIDPQQTKYPPLRDGDTPTDSGEPRGDEFADHVFVAAKNKRQPFVVDQQRLPVIDPDEVYSGCYVNMCIEFYGYSNSGNKGISAPLIGVQKVKDGERFGEPALEAEDVFTAICGGTSQVAPNLSFETVG